MEKVYLIVPYHDKETVKAMGARWDSENRLWYVFTDNPHIKRMKKYIDINDYKKCGIEPKGELHQLLNNLKNGANK